MSAHRGPHRVRHRGEFQIVPERVARVGINELQATGTVAAIADRQLLTFDFGERRIPGDSADADVMDAKSLFGPIGSASCRDRGCEYVWVSVVAVSLKKKY